MDTKENKHPFLTSLETKCRDIEEIRQGLRERASGELNSACVEGLEKLQMQLHELKLNTEKLLADNNILRIGIVGQVKAGKSSFLNSLFFNGEDVLPKAATPMTAGLTVLRHGDRKIEVEYFNRDEWNAFKKRADYFKKEYSKAKEEANGNLTEQQFIQEFQIPEEIVAAYEMVKSLTPEASRKIQDKSLIDTFSFSNTKNMHSQLSAYVGANGMYTPVVKSLILTMDDPRLKDMEIVDTPGVNDPVVSREQRTYEFLSQCHGVFFLSFTGSFFGSTDVSFLESRIGQQGISKVVVVGSKFDSALLDASMKYPDDLGGAIDYVVSGNRSQLRQNLQNTVFEGCEIPLESSSAISFQIANKLPDLNSEEQNIYNLMKESYPSFFTSPEESKNIFKELSQVKDIWEKYVENDFKNSKDEIIRAKINDFMKKNQHSLSEKVSSVIEALATRVEALEKGGLGDRRKQKDGIEKAICIIKDQLKSIVKIMEVNSRGKCRTIKNQCQINLPYVPTINKTITVSRKTTFWSRRTTFSVNCPHINSSSLRSAIDFLIKKTRATLEEDWKEFVKTQYDELDKGLRGVLNDSVEDLGGVLEQRLILNVINETISEYLSSGTIQLEKVNSFLAEVERIIQNNEFDPPSYGSMSEDEARDRVKERAQNTINKVQVAVESKLKELQQYLDSALDNAAKESVDVISTRREDFLRRIKEQVSKELDAINGDLENGEENLRQLRFVKAEIENKILNGK